MTDEAAPSHRADEPPTEPIPPPPPTGGAGTGDVPPAAPPPWFSADAGGFTFAREKLVRPRQGRYVAGVCGAIGRATNTDPVLWRVLLAVLAFAGGVGLLFYLIGWLAIPGEQDSASPIESLLGRGRSTMKPFAIVLLGAATVLTFAFVVNDGFRATLLAVGVLVAVAVLIKRGGFSTARPAAGTPPPPAPGPGPGPGPAEAPRPTDGPPFTGAPAFADAPAAENPAAAPATAPTEDTMSAPAQPGPPPAPPMTGPPPAAPQFAPPTSGFRPPFAPHGPYAGTAAHPPYPPAAPPVAPKPPKPPKERSKLGRITFSGLIMVMGLLVALDLAGLSVPVSAYFAAALATTALGLVVGAWFGRARGLIALALVATLGLGISTGLERFGGEVTNTVYRPATVGAIADRYDFTLGNATLDLRQVDFTGANQETTVQMRLGQVQVLLPPNVDATADVRIADGRANLFGQEWGGNDLGTQSVTDLGPDGQGGGTVKLIVQLSAGNVEVSR